MAKPPGYSKEGSRIRFQRRIPEDVRHAFNGQEWIRIPLDFPSERERIRSGIGLFVELVGDLRLSEIDGDKLRAFRDGPLATVPARLNHAESEFKTKGVKATIAAIRESGASWPILSAAERDQRMTWLCRMFRWLTGEW